MTRLSPATLVRLTVAVALTAVLLWKAHPEAVLHVAAHAGVGWIGAAVLLVLVDRGLMAYRWLVLLCPIDERPPFAAVIRVFFVSTFLGTFLPASVGGDAVRAYGLARLRVAPGPAVASVLMDRLLGVLSIVLVGIAGLIAAGGGGLMSNRAIDLSLAVAIAACAAAGLVVFSERAAALATAVAMRLPSAGLRKVAASLTQATRAYSRHHGPLATVLGASIGVQLLRITQAWCLGRALGIAAPPAVYFTFIPLILLVMLLPVSINGIGTSQVAFVWFFGQAAVPQAESFALSVLFVALGVVGNLPGGVLYAIAPRGQTI
ncbi:MAG: lysylphosphatidylglycerol synthase transmembrane domain-containing protein [Betaproteobacteria bacterium]